jgi:hypothetical protein
MVKDRTTVRHLLMIAPGVLTLGAFFLVPLGSVLVEAGRERALARFFGSAICSTRCGARWCSVSAPAWSL